jgi:GST-like protein
MYDLYTWSTPNGLKPLLLLEELGVSYRLHPVDLRQGQSRTPEFLRINPNGKIPALIVDAGMPEEVRIFESGAILIYVAEREKRFLAPQGPARAQALSWLMFQMSAVGPMIGQLASFLRASEPPPLAVVERFRTEVERILTVLEARLAEAEYLAGEYGIADMATFPWLAGLSYVQMSLEGRPQLSRWFEAIAARPAVERARSKKMV